MQQASFYKNFPIYILLFLSSVNTWALTPQIEGLGGGGRAGIPKEALFSNPAAVADLQSGNAFVTYTKSSVKDLGSGGRVQAAGIYDGNSEIAHGGAAYIRESRRRVENNTFPYVDYTNVRAVFGREVIPDLKMGLKVNYAVRYSQGKADDKYFFGDLGFIYLIFADLPIGITLENAMNEKEERPRSVNAGLHYAFSGPLGLYADGGRVVSGSGAGKSLWSLGSEITFFEEVVIRGALFQDSFFGKHGFSVGMSWFGPRTSFEYALRKTFALPQELDHVFGVSIVF